MLTVQYLMFAEKAQEDKNGELSVVKIFDKYYFDKLPNFMESFYIVIGVVGSQSDNDQQFTLKFRGSKHLKDDGFPFIYNYKEGISNIIILVEKFPINVFGIITLEVHYKNQVLNKCPLAILRKED
jgi:hypothetical protein